MVGWVNSRELNGDHFVIKKNNSSDLTLDYYLNKIDLDNYWIYKSTNKFKRVESIGKYARYIFFRKDLYCKDHIDKWIDYIHKISKSKFMYLDRPFPRISILNKIEVI